MRLMKVSNHYVICNKSNMLRINGKIFYNDITDIINIYSDPNSYSFEEGSGWAVGPDPRLCLCEFTTKEDLKDQMVEYLI